MAPEPQQRVELREDLPDRCTNGKLAPVTMAQWFANASSNFTTFDGSYLDTSNCTSFEQMFYNDTALLEITGTGSWITSKVTTFAGHVPECDPGT